MLQRRRVDPAIHVLQEPPLYSIINLYVVNSGARQSGESLLHHKKPSAIIRDPSKPHLHKISSSATTSVLSLLSPSSFSLPALSSPFPPVTLSASVSSAFPPVCRQGRNTLSCPIFFLILDLFVGSCCSVQNESFLSLNVNNTSAISVLLHKDA